MRPWRLPCPFAPDGERVLQVALGRRQGPAYDVLKSDAAQELSSVEGSYRCSSRESLSLAKLIHSRIKAENLRLKHRFEELAELYIRKNTARSTLRSL